MVGVRLGIKLAQRARLECENDTDKLRWTASTSASRNILQSAISTNTSVTIHVRNQSVTSAKESDLKLLAKVSGDNGDVNSDLGAAVVKCHWRHKYTDYILL